MDTLQSSGLPLLCWHRIDTIQSRGLPLLCWHYKAEVYLCFASTAIWPWQSFSSKWQWKYFLHILLWGFRGFCFSNVCKVRPKSENLMVKMDHLYPIFPLLKQFCLIGRKHNWSNFPLFVTIHGSLPLNTHLVCHIMARWRIDINCFP